MKDKFCQLWIKIPKNIMRSTKTRNEVNMEIKIAKQNDLQSQIGQNSQQVMLNKVKPIILRA